MNAPLVLEHVRTSDGATIAVKRRRAAGPPVIFLHGLAVNADLWDLPPIDGPNFRFRSLASLLHERGFDVWLVNLRGHGAPHMLSLPAPGQTDWCVDHFILYDLPAVVDHVVAQRRAAPVVIGASMGAMTLAGYAQGACWDGTRVYADHAVAAERQARLAGLIFAEFPAALRWPRSVYADDGRLRWDVLLADFWRNDSDANFPFEIMARLGWVEALVQSAGSVPLQWLRAAPFAAAAERIGPRFLSAFRSVEHRLAQAGLNLAGMFTGASQHRAEVLLRGRRFVVADMKAGVLSQLRRCVQAGAFVSALGDVRHIYSDHYQQIVAPTLVLAGGRDRIANPEVTRSAFYEHIRSQEREFRLFDEIAHGELEAAPLACQQVYPGVIEWIERRTR